MRNEDHAPGREQIIDELRLLLDAVAFRAEGYLAGCGSDAARDSQKQSGSTSCGWCPLCAVVSLLRGQRPELSAQLAEQLAALVTLLRQVLVEERASSHADSRAADGAPGGARSGDASESSPTKVQRIDVRRVHGQARPKERGC